MENLLSQEAIYYLNKKIRKYLHCNKPAKGIIVHIYIESFSGKLKRYAELMFDEYTGLMLSGNRRWKNLEPDKIYTLEELGSRSRIWKN